MQTRITLTGISPLIVQSPVLMDPFHPAVRELQKLLGKPAKDRTDEELLSIWKLQFYGCLYYSAELGPFIPGSMVLASLRDGGKRTSKGKKVQNALLIEQTEIPLEYPGPRQLDDLWDDNSYRLLKPVRNAGRGSSGGVLRCRPIFHKWALVVSADLDTGELDLAVLQEVAHAAGRFAGLGSWRPSTPKGGQYGRYEAVVEPV
jgi:hypothetical protein